MTGNLHRLGFVGFGAMPRRMAVRVGPSARSDLRDGLHKQVVSTKDQGAELLLGGDKMDGPGFFYPPTVFGSVVPGMTAFKEEIFGPVAAIITPCTY